MKCKTTNVLQLVNLVLKKIQKQKLFNSQHSLLITLSGGQDSTFCLLVLLILQNQQEFLWDRTRLLNLSKQYQIERLMEQLCTKKVNCTYMHKGKSTLLFKKTKIDYNNFSNLPVPNYTLLWCNHLWQKGSFFTMEHIARLIFCTSYTMYFFAPVRTLLSEQNARKWRHQVMERSSIFIHQKANCYTSIELYLNSVSLVHSKSIIEDNKKLFFNTNLGQSVQRTPLEKSINYSLSHIIQNNTSNTHYESKRLCIQGHTKSDRAEAILFNLIKGAGMNGVSTLQWKHIFLFSSDSNNTFYSMSYDFFKEIRAICLQPLFNNTWKRKDGINKNPVQLTFACKALRTKTKFWYAKLIQNFVIPKLRLGTQTLLLSSCPYQNFVLVPLPLPKLCSYTKSSALRPAPPKGIQSGALHGRRGTLALTKTSSWYAKRSFAYQNFVLVRTREEEEKKRTRVCKAELCVPRRSLGKGEEENNLNFVQVQQSRALHAWKGAPLHFTKHAYQDKVLISVAKVCTALHNGSFIDRKGSNKLELNLSSKNAYVKSLYYQLKYQTKNIR